MSTPIEPGMSLNLTFQEAVVAESTVLTAYRHKDPSVVRLTLRDAEQAHYRFGMTSHMCEVVTPSGSCVRIDRKASAGTIVEIPIGALKAVADKQFLVGIFGDSLLEKLAGISEPKTDHGSVRKSIGVKVESELRPVTKRIHDFVDKSLDTQRSDHPKF